MSVDTVFPKTPSRLRRSSLLKKLIIVTAAVVALYAILGFFALPPLVKSVLVKQITERLHRQADIRKVQINPFLLTVAVHGLSLKEPRGSDVFVSFDTLFLDLEAISVIKGGPVLREIRLGAPFIRIVRNEDFSYNFSDLLNEFTAPKPDTVAATSKPLLFSLNNIRIENGRIDVDDRPKHGHHAAADIMISIPFVSNLPYYLDTYVQPAFQAKFNGTPVMLAGKTKPFHDSRETSLDIDITNFDLPKYLEYVPTELNFKMPSGSLNTKLSLFFTEYRDKAPSLILRGMLTLNKLSLRDMDSEPLIDLPMFTVSIDPADIFAKRIVFKSILLQSPDLFVRREKTGRLNIQSLIPKQEPSPAAEKQPPEKAKPSAPERALQIEAVEVRVADGKVTFHDDATEKPFQASLRTLNVVVNHFSTVPKQTTSIEVSAETAAGETLRHVGTFTVQPVAAEGQVELHGVPMKRYAAYYGQHLLFDVLDGMLSASTGYQYSEGDTKISGLDVSLASVRLKRKGEQEAFLKIPALSIKNTDIDLDERNIMVGQIATKKGTVVIRRANDGTVNLSKLTAVPAASGASPSSAPAAGTASSTPTEPVSPPWVVTVKTLSVEQYAVTVDDHVPSPPATLVANPIAFRAENISTAKNAKGTASLRMTLNKSSLFTVSGSVRIEPLSATLALDLKNLDLMPLQPYFTDRLKITVTSGNVSTRGTLTVETTADRTLGVAFTGDADLADLATLDKANSEDFLKWNSLSIQGIKAGNNPPRADINVIALSDFYSRLIVNADGSLNVQDIMVKPPVPAEQNHAAAVSTAQAAAAPPAQPARVTIGAITMEGGSVDFSDRFIKPNYSAKLAELSGRISGLSSEESRTGDVDIRGNLGTGAPLTITGKINPLGNDLFVDLLVDFKDIELGPLTPYSAKYAGYAIEKGKLTLQLKYLIDKRKLEAHNKVLLDQFTFGEKVDSPSATKLPVRFAISLLKDRNGLIDLDLPVSGSLDDPQFSIWGVIGKILTNLLTKAATAPFALLGSLLGGTTELSHVEFAYGSADLSSAVQDSLKTMAKVLFERPALQLDLAGHVDTEKDQEALRQKQFDRKLKAQKLTELTKKGTTPATLNDVKVEPNEYTRYLTLAYKKETFQKPRNVLGMTKDLEVPEMEKLILAHIIITEDDLRELAKQRAEAVKDDLVTRKIEPSRIFLLAASLKPSQDKPQKLKDSRVDFVVR